MTKFCSQSLIEKGANVNVQNLVRDVPLHYAAGNGHLKIATSFSNGRKHDFRIFRESKVAILPKTKILADAGYGGMQKIHKNVALPYRKTKKNPLSKEQKKENRSLSPELWIRNLV